MNAAELIDLYRRLGGVAYEGEGVTQWQHAWQCGQLARQSGASPALQLAAWLHDAGHLMAGHAGTPTLNGVDDRHEERAARVLASLFGPAVAQPVALHVQAKRYLVRAKPAYRRRLSADSLRSLALQGGPMDDAACAEFMQRPHAEDAVRLRVWDDASKVTAWTPRDDGFVALCDLIDTVGAGLEKR